MNNDRFPSRRDFLRTALAAPVAGAMAGSYTPAAAQDISASGTSSVVARVILDKQLYDAGTVVNGQVHFRLPAGGRVVVRWLDSFGRVVREKELPASKSGVAQQNFEFPLDPGFTYRNWIRVWVNGVEQTAGAQFMLSPAPKPWDDFHVISWAFLVLAAQYESWKLPLAIVLIVPMCLLASATGLAFRGMPIDILAQIGFVVLVGLAAKNAILIVEFARQRQDHDGDEPEEAAIAAAGTRLRPILMTSFAFILGVFPLAMATGAGSEMRQSLGTAVFFGMLGVTAFGLLFTPAFYTFVRKLGERRPA